MSTEPFTDDEITAFSQKLEEWGTTLPEREQILLLELVSRANQATDEVEGFSFNSGWSFNSGNAGNAGNAGIEPGDYFRTGTFSTSTKSALGNVQGFGIIIVDC